MQLLNVTISPPRFKYKDLALLPPLLKEGDYMTTINLKDGFFHVPVLPSHQAYMPFQWEGKTYVFQVLPFGMRHHHGYSLASCRQWSVTFATRACR